MDRNEVDVLEELDLVLEGCRVLEELDLVLEGCRVLEAEEDLETSVTTAILTFFWYFSVAIIRLLSTYNAITAIFETSPTYKRH